MNHLDLSFNSIFRSMCPYRVEETHTNDAYERLAHIVKEHVNTIGAGLLDGCVQRRDCLVIVGSIEPNALEKLHFLITASTTFGGHKMGSNTQSTP